MTNYTIDFNGKTITLAKKFAKAASAINTPAYNTVKQLRADYPDFTFEMREIKKPQKKQSYANLTYDAMRKYLRLVEGEDSVNLRQLEVIIDMSQGQAGRYAYVKTWFLHRYPDYQNATAFEN